MTNHKKNPVEIDHEKKIGVKSFYYCLLLAIIYKYIFGYKYT